MPPDHPEHTLYYKTRQCSLSTAQTPTTTLLQACKATYMKIVQPPRAERQLAAALRAASIASSRLHQKPPRSRERFLDLQSPLILLSSHFCFLQGNRNSEVKYQQHMTWFEVSSCPDLLKKITNRLLQCKTKLKVKLDCEKS